ncbi:MAG: hypothetical protein ACOCRX_09795 [Candidatus Woesearchaeota archaeon]
MLLNKNTEKISEDIKDEIVPYFMLDNIDEVESLVQQETLHNK